MARAPAELLRPAKSPPWMCTIILLQQPGYNPSVFRDGEGGE